MGKKRYRILRNDTGSALILALLILLVLTLLGISAINTTTFETVISGNERARVEAFYAAEAGIQEALSRLPNTASIKETKLRENRYYWGGTPEDRSNPKGPEFPGFALGPGDDPSEGVYRRYRIRITGLASGTAQQVEVQVKFNEPVSSGTNYDRN